MLFANTFDYSMVIKRNIKISKFIHLYAFNPAEPYLSVFFYNAVWT